VEGGQWDYTLDKGVSVSRFDNIRLHTNAANQTDSLSFSRFKPGALYVFQVLPIIISHHH
jgi:hypothetical protein